MNKPAIAAFILALLMTGLAPADLSAQSVTSQGSSSGGSCQYDWSIDFERLVRLSNQSFSGDSTTVPLESAGYPTTNRETWYVALEDTAEGAAFNRLTSASDSMDSPLTSESGYVFDRLLGYPWIPGVDGFLPREALTPISRYVLSGDHRTWLTSSPPGGGYVLDETFDAQNANPRFGYERFGNALTFSDVNASAYGDLILENPHYKVEFNEIWGNAIGRINYKPLGTQLVLDGIGDLVQSLIRFGSDDPNCRNPNPTQSGGAYCSTPTGPTNYGMTERWIGSPVVSTTVLEDGVEPTKTASLRSKVRPLEFCHNGQSLPDATPWPNTDPFHPLAWNGHLVRTDTVGCRMENTNFVWPDIIKSTSQAELAYSGQTDDLINLENVYWLKAFSFGDYQQGDFTVELVDLSNQQVMDIGPFCDGGSFIFNQPCVLTGLDNSFPYAVLVSKIDGSFAIAFVRLELQSLSRTSVWIRCSNPCNPQDAALIIAMFHRSVPVVQTGFSDEMTSYMIANTRSIVLSRLATLSQNPGDCPLILPGLIFEDGFESGDTSAWSGTAP